IRRVGTRIPPGSSDIEAIIRDAAAAQGANAEQLLRVAYCESRYNPGAYNASGASGLFQFLPSTWTANSVRAGFAGASVWDPRALRDVLRRHGVRAATSLGQRFLVDRAVLAAIVDAAELSSTDDVLEVGPGPGVLTAALAARVRSVTAVEVDPRMIALLGETLADHKNVQVIQADALKVDLLGIAARPIPRLVAHL